MRRLTIEKMQDIAGLRHGRCLSLHYKNAHSKLKWECHLGHKWSALPCNISRGKWCPYCKSGRSEERCRFILEQLTGLQFLKTRSVIDGELDGFCEKLNLAFEYQGIQHFEDVAIFREKTKDIQKRDRVKRALCKQMKIILFEIPYYIAESGIPQLEQYIINLLSTVNIPYSSIKIDYSRIDYVLVDRINRCRDNDNIVCTGIDRIGKGVTYVKMSCSKSHNWVTQSYSVLYRKYGCPFCAGQRRTINDVHKIAQQKDGECLSKKYLAANSKLQWKCFLGHSWAATLNKVLCGRWCPKCAKDKRIKTMQSRKGYSYEKIRLMHQKGKSVKDICYTFNICSRTVANALKGI